MSGRLSTAEVCVIFYIIMNKACSMNKLYKGSNRKAFFLGKGRGSALFSGHFLCHSVAEHHKQGTPALTAKAYKGAVRLNQLVYILRSGTFRQGAKGSWSPVPGRGAFRQCSVESLFYFLKNCFELIIHIF